MLFLAGVFGMVAAGVSVSTQDGYIAITALAGGCGMIAAIAAAAQRVAQPGVAMGVPLGLAADGLMLAGEGLLIWGIFRFQKHVGDWRGCETSFTLRKCTICMCLARSERSMTRVRERTRSVVGKGRRRRSG